MGEEVEVGVGVELAGVKVLVGRQAETCGFQTQCVVCLGTRDAHERMQATMVLKAKPWE
jgi:hypothetical protein